MADVQDVAKFFIDLAQKQEQKQNGDLMTNLRLQKMLYLAQGWYLAKFGAPLFDAPIEAWPLGPVVPTVYNTYKIYHANGISSDARISSDALSSNEISLLLDVTREYDKFSTSALVSLTHKKDTPWAMTASADEISKDIIKDFFQTQEPLSSFDDILSHIETIVPTRDKEGNAILPSDFDDDWGEYNAG